jgi:transglutaminase-like putative cysteine protease
VAIGNTEEKMKKTELIVVLLTLSLLGLMSCSQVKHPEQVKQPEEGKVREFELNYETTLSQIPEGSQELKLWIPVPRDTQHQKISDFEVTTIPETKFEIRDESLRGNRMIYLNVKNPRAGIHVKMTMKVKRWENIAATYASTPKLDDKETLEGNRLIPINGKSIALAEFYSAGARNNEESALAFVQQTMKHMKYDKSGEGWGHGDFLYACDAAAGNCSDFHAYFIGLCRAKGIPAYFEIGLPLQEDLKEGATGAYHCWAYYKVGENWVPVDISEAWKQKTLENNQARCDYFLKSHCENRVAFSTGRDIVLSPAQAGEPLNYFIGPYAEVDGKSFEGIKRQTTFKDLN